MKSRIFLEGADPSETKVIAGLLGDLDGQVVRPDGLAENTEVKNLIEESGLFDRKTFTDYYQDIVEQIVKEIPKGSIVAAVYTSTDSTADELIEEGKEVALWASNVHPQLPASLVGIESASMLTQAGFRVAVSQVCSQQQAGLVYDITTQALEGDVFVTLDISYLDNNSCDGRSLVEHVQKIYDAGNSHVSVLMGGVKDIETLVWGLECGIDAISASGDVLRQWMELGRPMKLTQEQSTSLLEKGVLVPYEQIDITQEKNSYTLSNDLTDQEIRQEAACWGNLLKK